MPYQRIKALVDRHSFHVVRQRTGEVTLWISNGITPSPISRGRTLVRGKTSGAGKRVAWPVMPLLDVQLMTKDQNLSFQRDPRLEQ
jgi:hypothetical protein